MKKVATILTAVALLASNGAFAQQSNKSMNTGKAAQDGQNYSYDKFAWGIGFGMLTVVAVVVGISAGVGAQIPPNSSGGTSGTSSSTSSSSVSH